MKELSDLEKHYLRVLLRKETPIKEEAKSLYRLWKEARKGKIHSKECNKIDNDLRTLISYAFVFHGSWQSKKGSNGNGNSNGKIKRRMEEKALGLIIKRLESELNRKAY